MLTPYHANIDPHRTRPIYEQEERLIIMGYDFLGWNPTTKDNVALMHCVDEGHNYTSYFPGVRQTHMHMPDGSDVTEACSRCRIYWKLDRRIHDV